MEDNLVVYALVQLGHAMLVFIVVMALMCGVVFFIYWQTQLAMHTETESFMKLAAEILRQ